MSSCASPRDAGCSVQDQEWGQHAASQESNEYDEDQTAGVAGWGPPPTQQQQSPPPTPKVSILDILECPHIPEEFAASKQQGTNDLAAGQLRRGSEMEQVLQRSQQLLR